MRARFAAVNEAEAERRGLEDERTCWCTDEGGGWCEA